MDIEEKYQQLQHRDHIYKLPDTYIGSIELVRQEMFVLDAAQENIVKRELDIVPGFFKIFDEILVNALDHRQRDPTVRILKVDFALGREPITVYNDGSGIDICIHPQTGVYVPEMLFGHLLTSSNYREDERRTTGGKNGYGATLVNIFSTAFTVETVDATRKLKYVQDFYHNATRVDPPVIAKNSGKSYTRIRFTPDYDKFNLEGLTPDMFALFQRRIYDAAALTDLHVHLNGEKLKIKSFDKYIERFASGYKVWVLDQPRWRVGLLLSPTREFAQVSFVNGIWTSKGGRHVDYVLGQLVEQLKNVLARHPRTKLKTFKTSQLKDHLWLFVDAVVENPSFTSQTKEELTTKSTQFGSTVRLEESWVERWVKHTHPCGDSFLERILESMHADMHKTAKKSDGTKKSTLRGIPKLDDAIFAGTRKSRECMLILTEGDSAKASVLSGLSALGSSFRDTFGVFPLRGKFINVRDMGMDRVCANEEVKALKTILGLQHGKVYTTENLGELRYGSVALATDQDADAAHIRGLLLNFFHVYWPSLLQLPGFFKSLITPIVKAFRPGVSPKWFYTLKDYRAFRATLAHEKWTFKYYKGLGTSTSQEFKEYFRQLEQMTRYYEWDADEPLVMVFHKAQANARKDWLQTYDPEETLEYYQGNRIRLTDFVHKDLKHFSNYDNIRSIPCAIDGLKPSQRKVLFGMLKRSRTGEIKVAQLASYVSETTHYHHGEASLEQTIVGLAQQFVGKNNLPLLQSKGQFGTRLQGGADHAQSRYIFTELHEYTPMLFDDHDFPLLTLNEEESKSIEPVRYYPILPTVLTAGIIGIGTGYSTFIPAFHPIDLCDALLGRNQGDTDAFLRSWIPWYRGFRGRIEATEHPLRFTVHGQYSLESNRLRITELPIGTWTQVYKEYLEQLLAAGSITQYVDKSTDELVSFDISLTDKLAALDTEVLEHTFKLTTKLSLNNMYLYKGTRLHRFESVAEILEYYYAERLAMYTKRKAHVITQLSEQHALLAEKIRFIQEVSAAPELVVRQTRERLHAALRARHYIHVDALLQLPIFSWTHEKIQELQAESARLQKTISYYQHSTEQKLWNEDLTRLRHVLVKNISPR